MQEDTKRTTEHENGEPQDHQFSPEQRMPALDLSEHTKGSWPSSKNVNQ
jgi:hypothetical protein